MKSEKIVKARRRAWVHWTFLTLFFIGIPSFAHADINDILLKFNPYIAVQEAYSNNIFLTKTNKLNDFITTVYPGLSIFRFEARYLWDQSGCCCGIYLLRKKSRIQLFQPRREP